MGRRSPSPDAHHREAIRLNPHWILGVLAALLGVQNLLLWRFLDFASAAVYLIGSGLLVVVTLAIGRGFAGSQWPGPSLRTTAILALVALGIFVLGGEVGIFYSNSDWQVRDAVLRDLVINPWPFVYQAAPSADVLRAPIAMYLVPAVIGKLLGVGAADIALLLQNSLMLTLLLALGSTLIERGKGMLTLAVLILFSGMDIVGWLARSLWSGDRIANHLEQWGAREYSAHITQAFWVPQHALAGWCGALLFLLWQRTRISLGTFYAFVPLLLLLSPIGAMGALPFAAYAGIAWLGRERGARDLLLPIATALLAIPAILYLTADWSAVGSRPLPISLPSYLAFVLVEAVPYLLLVAVLARGRADLWTDVRVRLALVAACLLLMPFAQIGETGDFTMRASITALAILAFDVALVLGEPSPAGSKRLARKALIVTLAIGSVTGAAEIARAFYFRASPRTRCNLETAWPFVKGHPGLSKSIYLIPAGSLPSAVKRRQTPAVVPPDDPKTCWDRPWSTPRWGRWR